MDLTRRAFLAGLAAGAAGCAANDLGDAASSAGTAGRPEPSGSTETETDADTDASRTTGSIGARASFVVRGRSDSDKVALTFHTNGDLKLAQRIVDAFAEHRAVMTNFIVGDWLAANTSWARRLVDGGHELANHTYTHPTFSALGRTAMLEEITRCRDVIARLSGSPGAYFRPSGTDDGLAEPSASVLAAAATAGYGTVLGWDVEPFDYKDPGADAVRQRVLGAVVGGSIVSLHFGHQGTVDAMPAILDGLATRGLRTATVSDLLA